jgi:hypothetical protein
MMTFWRDWPRTTTATTAKSEKLSSLYDSTAASYGHNAAASEVYNARGRYEEIIYTYPSYTRGASSRPHSTYNALHRSCSRDIPCCFNTTRTCRKYLPALPQQGSMEGKDGRVRTKGTLRQLLSLGGQGRGGLLGGGGQGGKVYRQSRDATPHHSGREVSAARYKWSQAYRGTHSLYGLIVVEVE